MIHITAKKWIGTPFRHQGRGPDYLDCVGLLVVACRDYGIELKDCRDYGRDPHRGMLESHLDRCFTNGELKPGAIVCCAFPIVPRHVAIVGEYIHGGLSLIHTWNRVGRVIEHRLDDRWMNRIRGVWEVRA